MNCLPGVSAKLPKIKTLRLTFKRIIPDTNADYSIAMWEDTDKRLSAHSTACFSLREGALEEFQPWHRNGRKEDQKNRDMLQKR